MPARPRKCWGKKTKFTPTKDSQNYNSWSEIEKIKYLSDKIRGKNLINKFIFKNKENIAVLCPSFISDCLETLEEIDIRGRKTFFDAGGKNMTYIPCLNDSEDT